jgi:colanic acid biosynthesis glycosyl transferase WcaI
MSMPSAKVLLYSINFAPELTGIGKFNGEMVGWLTGHGYEVRVVTAPPYYPQWKAQEGYAAGAYAKEEMQGAKVWRCPIWIPEHASGLKRLIHLASFAISSLPVLLKQMFWRPDVLIVLEPPLAAAPAAVCLAKLFGVKSWLHVQDFEVDAAFELGLLPRNKVLRSIVSGVETWLMRRFDIVSSISGSMLNRLLKKDVESGRVKYFPNWVDTEAIYPMPVKPTLFREQLGFSEDDFVILYAGNLGAKQGLDVLLDAAERVQQHADMKFVLCGEGAAKEKLIEESKRRSLSNVTFLPLQPLSRLNELLNTADVHALIQKKSASDLVMPSKLTGMLASGRPVIATADEHTAVFSVLKTSRAGVLVPPEDAERLAEALFVMSQYKDSCDLLGQCGRTYAVDHLSIESIMREMEQTLLDATAVKTIVHEERIRGIN